MLKTFCLLFWTTAVAIAVFTQTAWQSDYSKTSVTFKVKHDDLFSHLKAFISSLNDEARAKTLFAYDTPERLTWARHPSPRKGFALKDMSASQRQIINDMLENVLSENGYTQAKAIMADQDVLAKNEAGLGSGYFWVAIYGKPGENEPWAWRIGGHHLSLHFTFVDNKLVSCTPAFFGAEQTLPPDDPQEAGYKLLVHRRDLARTLIQSLSQEQATQAFLASRVSRDLVISEAQNFALGQPIGVPASRLNENQRALLFRVIEEYANVFKSSFIQTRFEKITRSDLEKIYFAWAGTFNEHNAEQYYRIHGQTFLLEYSNSGSHMHSVWRELNDFGALAGGGDSDSNR
jgi:hypothetical protein